MANFKVVWLSNHDSYTFSLHWNNFIPENFLRSLVEYKLRCSHGGDDWKMNMESKTDRYINIQYLDIEDELVTLGTGDTEFESFKKCVETVMSFKPVTTLFVSFKQKKDVVEKSDLFSKVMNQQSVSDMVADTTVKKIVICGSKTPKTSNNQVGCISSEGKHGTRSSTEKRGQAADKASEKKRLSALLKFLEQGVGRVTGDGPGGDLPTVSWLQTFMTEFKASLVQDIEERFKKLTLEHSKQSFECEYDINSKRPKTSDTRILAEQEENYDVGTMEDHDEHFHENECAIMQMVAKEIFTKAFNGAVHNCNTMKKNIVLITDKPMTSYVYPGEIFCIRFGLLVRRFHAERTTNERMGTLQLTCNTSLGLQLHSQDANFKILYDYGFSIMSIKIRVPPRVGTYRLFFDLQHRDIVLISHVPLILIAPDTATSHILSAIFVSSRRNETKYCPNKSCVTDAVSETSMPKKISEEDKHYIDEGYDDTVPQVVNGSSNVNDRNERNESANDDSNNSVSAESLINDGIEFLEKIQDVRINSGLTRSMHLVPDIRQIFKDQKAEFERLQKKTILETFDPYSSETKNKNAGPYTETEIKQMTNEIFKTPGKFLNDDSSWQNVESKFGKKEKQEQQQQECPRASVSSNDTTTTVNQKQSDVAKPDGSKTSAPSVDILPARVINAANAAASAFGRLMSSGEAQQPVKKSGSIAQFDQYMCDLHYDKSMEPVLKGYYDQHQTKPRLGQQLPYIHSSRGHIYHHNNNGNIVKLSSSHASTKNSPMLCTGEHQISSQTPSKNVPYTSYVPPSKLSLQNAYASQSSFPLQSSYMSPQSTLQPQIPSTPQSAVSHYQSTLPQKSGFSTQNSTHGLSPYAMTQTSASEIPSAMFSQSGMSNHGLTDSSSAGVYQYQDMSKFAMSQQMAHLMRVAMSSSPYGTAQIFPVQYSLQTGQTDYANNSEYSHLVDPYALGANRNNKPINDNRPALFGGDLGQSMNGYENTVRSESIVDQQQLQLQQQWQQQQILLQQYQLQLQQRQQQQQQLQRQEPQKQQQQK